MQILIAEDDPTIRANLARTLRLEGHEALAADNGRQAMELLEQHTPALILSDVMMPEVDGHALLKWVRENNRFTNTPFVFLTARADRSDVREGMNLGADDYLTKPFQRDELLAMLQTQLKRGAQRSEATQKLQQEAQRLRLVDVLTDLPNRTALIERCQQAVQIAGREQGRLAVASLAIDGLADYRQVHGPRAADEVIRCLANRLFVAAAEQSELRATLARTGEDRFALLLPAYRDEEALEAQLRPWLGLTGNLQVAGQSLFFASSLGIARFPDDADSGESLLLRAEAAQPPATPEGALAFHSADTNARIGRRLQLMQALHHALAHAELFLHYQPQVSIAQDRVIGFEALLRWQHPEFGFVSPAEFVPIAEESGLIVPIGAWVMEQAARQMADWRERGLGDLRIAVNLSSRQFSDDDLPARVEAVLARSGLPPAALELEITESIAMQSAERTLSILRTLKRLGVHLAMDDFGTGYSSLSYLKLYPLDVLKIDQAFVRHLTTDRGDAAITRAVIALAKSFDMEVVAEGVETQAHVDQLREFGCDVCQGYLFSRPLSADAASAWLRERPRNGR